MTFHAHAFALCVNRQTRINTENAQSHESTITLHFTLLFTHIKMFSLGTLLMALRGRSTRTVRMADRLIFCRSSEYSTILDRGYRQREKERQRKHSEKREFNLSEDTWVNYWLKYWQKKKSTAMAPAGPEIPAHDSTSVVILWSSHTCLPPRAAVWASTEWGIESKECCNTPEKVVVVVVVAGGIKWQSIKKEENNMKERWGRESEREREQEKRDSFYSKWCLQDVVAQSVPGIC